MTYTQTAGGFKVGPALFRFVEGVEPAERDRIVANAERASRRRREPAGAANPRRTKDDHTRTAIAYARWLAERDGIDVSDAGRWEVEWCDARLTAGTVPRKPTDRDRRPYVASIQAIRWVRFYHGCRTTGGGYGGKVERVGGELLAEFAIPGWDHHAMPVAEGPVSFLHNFQERRELAQRLSATAERFARAADLVPEAAEIPPEERTPATVENLEGWATDARRAAWSRETYERELEYLTPEHAARYGMEPSAWEVFADLAASEEDREAARLEIALYRLYLAEGADGRPRPFAGDARIPDPDRPNRRALVETVGGRHKSLRCASKAYAYPQWSHVALADRAWHEGDAVRERFKVLEHESGARWALLRYSWGPRRERLVDLVETTKAETAQAWCCALKGETEAPEIQKADPERVAARSPRGCYVAVERGCYVRHAGTLQACQKAAEACEAVLVLALPGGWPEAVEDSALYANARAWLAGERQRVASIDIARWSESYRNAHCWGFADWLTRLGLWNWALVKRLGGGGWGHGYRLGLPAETHETLKAVHKAAVAAALDAGDDVPSSVLGYYRWDHGLRYRINQRLAA